MSTFDVARRVKDRRKAGSRHVAPDGSRPEFERRSGLFREGVVPREELERAQRDLAVALARADELRERARVVVAEARGDERARAEGAVQLARAQLSEAKALLDKTRVVAPIDGVVLRRHRRTGESVSVEAAAAAVVTVADVSRLRVRADVDETDVARLTPGQTAWVTADAYGDTRFPARVVRLGQTLGRKNIRTDEPTERVDTKVLETLLDLDPSVRLPLGLRVDVFIEGQ